jgi:hypothetical protein
VIQCQILRVLVIAAVLAAVTITNVNAGPFHRRLSSVAPDMYVVPQPDNGRYRENRRRRVQNIVAIVLLDEHGAAKPKADSTSDADCAERLIRKVQQ